MDKQQFVEKSLKIFDDNFGFFIEPEVRSYGGKIIKSNQISSNDIKDFFQSKLSECWDMAGEEKAEMLVLQGRKILLHELNMYLEDLLIKTDSTIVSKQEDK